MEYLKEQLGKMLVKLNSHHKKITEANRKKWIELCGEYANFEQAQEAYGWGFISELEFEMLKKHFQSGEDALDEDTKWSVAYDYLKHFYSNICGSIRYLKYELLTPQEKEQYQKNAEEWQKRKEEIKNKRNGELK